ncbi:hypothetical protein LIER_34422 [Lithospermum erythrorhizon]|uniref:Uncharacterized protein n=1 Tax=Lithospermum erythrorhizon TaxID=34254 RepID=A0AAV3S089_LITER
MDEPGVEPQLDGVESFGWVGSRPLEYSSSILHDRQDIVDNFMRLDGCLVVTRIASKVQVLELDLDLNMCLAGVPQQLDLMQLD